MKQMHRWLLGGSLLAASPLLLAHSGHGSQESQDSGWWHYLVEPLHLVGIVAVVAGAVGLLVVLRRMRRPHHPQV